MMYWDSRFSTDATTYIHDAKTVENNIQNQFGGPALLQEIQKHGMSIEMTFLHKDHPEKKRNYMASWQEKFENEDPEKALRAAIRRVDDYDDCWIEKSTVGGFEYINICTIITLPGYLRREFDGEYFLRFPRIAATKPEAHNGWRKFKLGNGNELTQ